MATAFDMTSAREARAAVEEYLAANQKKSLLRFITCGSVDDGKSTLIGRLLYDSKMLFEDQLAALASDSRRIGTQGEALDFALLVDGLGAEREQGITIDVAYRFFATDRRKFIVADTPGHEQYTRNMVTGASTADAAVILIDARKGVLTQTRRHSFLTHLLGIRHLVLAINKMDLVDYSQEAYEKIKADYLEFAAKVGIQDIRFIPLSALNGDMIVDRGDSLNWYDGPTLLEILESAPAAHTEHDEPFRFPVQYVCRPQDSANPELHDYRGFMGRVESGSIQVGDAVTVLPSGRESTVKAVQLGGEDIGSAFTEQSITLLLADEIDTSRGDMIVKTAEAPAAVKEIRATVCWLSETPLDRARTYLIRHTTRDSKAKLTGIDHRLDVNTLEKVAADKLAMNDIAEVSFKLAQPLFVDPYLENRATGAFIVIDESNNNTVGAGMIL